MNGLGELILYIIYYFLLASGLVFLILTFIVKRKMKFITIILSVISIFLFFQFKSCKKENYKIVQKREVGIYYLTQYPDCNNCFVRLNENMTYDVVKNDTVIETGNWHTEIGQDYWITYMNNDKDQLGCNRFSYDKYKKKYAEDK